MKIFALACLWCVWHLPQFMEGATTLASYQPGVAPGAPFWSTSGSSTHVTAQNVQTSGESAWLISDPGLGASTKTSNSWLKHTVSTDNRALLKNGWEATMRLKIPDLAEMSDTRGWDVNSNTWWSVSTPLDGSGQHTYALMFGRNAGGEGILQAYSNSGTKILTSGFHNYRMVYDPSVSTSSVAVYVDGELWKMMSPSVIASTNHAEMVWGDNLSQSSEIVPRAAYFGAISFTAVPEPLRGFLTCLGLGVLALRRRR